MNGQLENICHCIKLTFVFFNLSWIYIFMYKNKTATCVAKWQRQHVWHKQRREREFHIKIRLDVEKNSICYTAENGLLNFRAVSTTWLRLVAELSHSHVIMTCFPPKHWNILFPCSSVTFNNVTKDNFRVAYKIN